MTTGLPLHNIQFFGTHSNFHEKFGTGVRNSHRRLEVLTVKTPGATAESNWSSDIDRLLWCL